MDNAPKFTYSISPTFGTVSETSKFELTIRNESADFAVPFGKLPDTILISNWGALTASVSAISPEAEESPWKAGLDGDAVKIFSLQKTEVPPGGTVKITIDNVALDNTPGEVSLNVTERIGGVTTTPPPPPLRVGKLGAEMQIVAYADPPIVGLDQPTTLNWTIVKGLGVIFFPPQTSKQYCRQGTGPWSDQALAFPSQKDFQTTFTVRVQNTCSQVEPLIAAGIGARLGDPEFIDTHVVVTLSSAVITRFESDRLSPISIDQPLELSWATRYSNRVKLEPATGSAFVRPEGRRVIKPETFRILLRDESKIAFKLTASGFRDDVMETLEFQLVPVRVKYFRYDSFEKVSVMADYSNWTKVSITLTSTPMVLIANGPGGPLTQFLGGTGLEIQVLVAEPPAVNAGGETTLKYQVQKAATLKLMPGDVTCPFDASGIGQVKVNPAATTLYTLVATGSDGGSAHSDITVEVAPAASEGRGDEYA